MSKISSTVSCQKLLLKMGVTALAGLIGQTALAACPAVDNLNDLVRVNQITDVDGSTIYFCKTSSYVPPNSRDPRLEFKVEQEDLVTGGSQAISQNSRSNTIQNLPSNPQINLGSFDLSATNLKPGTLIAAFPNSTAGTSDLFNFYTRRLITSFFRPSPADSQAACGNPQSGDYKIIETYLQSTPNIFKINSINSSGISSSSKGFLQFSNVKLVSSIAPSSNITADLYLYHMNNETGQFFTRDAPGSRPGSRRNYVYCWFGVRAELEIKPNHSGANLQHAGEYILNVDVNHYK